VKTATLFVFLGMEKIGRMIDRGWRPRQPVSNKQAALVVLACFWVVEGTDPYRKMQNRNKKGVPRETPFLFFCLGWTLIL